MEENIRTPLQLREGWAVVPRKVASESCIAKLGLPAAAAEYYRQPPENRDWLTPMAAKKESV